MPWLKKQQPISLYQSSDIPYVILEDGVHLCYDNSYGTQESKEEFNIKFQTSVHNLKRINTHYYRFINFPVIIPFEHIIFLNNNIITEGKIVEDFSKIDNNSQSAVMINSRMLKDLNDMSPINDIIDVFDTRFIVVEDSIDNKIRLLEDVATIIPHSHWNRTMTTVAHNMCGGYNRKYCWTKDIPEVSLDCYGILNQEEFESIHQSLDNIGVSNIDVNWAQLEDSFLLNF